MLYYVVLRPKEWVKYSLLFERTEAKLAKFHSVWITLAIIQTMLSPRDPAARCNLYRVYRHIYFYALLCSYLTNLFFSTLGKSRFDI